MSFIKRFTFVGTDLSERDATLCFVWSRMLFVDEENTHSRVKMTCAA
jgi:hypothetical protein